ncbi:MAG: hypothetical protein J5804_03870, partial [Eggerthellaceae bacterium]|nr:hypothetical protein [Eggerthellaceae bacterium]
MAQKQPIDDRVLQAARRAIARARGQEQISVEPVDQGVSPSTSARLYKVNPTGSFAPIESEPPVDHAQDSAESAESASSTHDVPLGTQDRPQGSSAVQDTAKNVFSQDGDQPTGSQQPERPTESQESYRQARSQQPKPRYTGTTGRLEDSAPVPRVAKDRRPSAGLPTLKRSVPEEAGAFLDAFFAQLKRCGVHNVVVSPGSRSTPLAMKAYEHYGDVYVDVDERGAAFFALGLAKATGNVVALVCTSGTAVGNWMPAVLEAEASRVPLLLLSADVPPRLQGVGSSQTCDQLHLFGTHVRKFVQMPMPSGGEESLAFARQVAMDACVAAHGALPNVASADAGPVHLNFPFDEPLKPAPCEGEVKTTKLPAAVVAGQGIMSADAIGLFKLISGKRVIALCGE